VRVFSGILPAVDSDPFSPAHFVVGPTNQPSVLLNGSSGFWFTVTKTRTLEKRKGAAPKPLILKD
jgi:hypothetical protein